MAASAGGGMGDAVAEFSPVQRAPSPHAPFCSQRADRSRSETASSCRRAPNRCGEKRPPWRLADEARASTRRRSASVGKMSVVEERPLYGRLMGAIHDSHSFGNSVGMVKLPLLLLDIRLYGGAIAQFYILTRALEGELAKHADHPLVRHVRSGLGLPPLAFRRPPWLVGLSCIPSACLLGCLLPSCAFSLRPNVGSRFPLRVVCI